MIARIRVRITIANRITTPAMAYALGSSFIVVGRSITGAEDPVAAYHRAKREFSEGM